MLLSVSERKYSNMKSEEMISKLRLRYIAGVACIVLGVQDLAAWSQFVSFDSGWLMRIAGGDWLEPMAGLILVGYGAFLAGPSVMQAFSLWDTERKVARQTALVAGFVAALAAVYALETLVPSTDVLPVVGHGGRLSRDSRQMAILALLVCSGGIAGFLIMRTKDVGFWKLLLPVQRENEIWSLSIKMELAFRAVGANEELLRMIEHRIHFVQAEVGAKFDRLCEPLIKESADLSTIDSTARLQMDVGHVFKRYADFHRHLAETRHRLCDQLMELTYDAVLNLFENHLPGLNLRKGIGRDIKISISHPVLNDTAMLQRRRAEWDETLRSIVSIGAETGNQIIGDWLERAARGDISREDVPTAAQALRALCQMSGEDSASNQGSMKGLPKLIELSATQPT
jgi:hypothetical protein